MKILEIILGNVAMNKLRLMKGNTQRTTLFQKIKNIVLSYGEAIAYYSEKSIMAFLILIINIVIDIAHILTLTIPTSLSVIIVIVILNFISFRLITNR